MAANGQGMCSCFYVFNEPIHECSLAMLSSRDNARLCCAQIARRKPASIPLIRIFMYLNRVGGDTFVIIFECTRRMVRLKAVGAFPHPGSASISMLGPRRRSSSVFVGYIILIDTVDLNGLNIYICIGL